jgi:hypothetical protein
MAIEAITAAFIAPAEVPEMASIVQPGFLEQPVEHAPGEGAMEPPPCKARSISDVRTEVVDKVDAQAHALGNRFYAGSPIYPGNFAHDWNRSYILEPDGAPIGAVVLLHGLTDSPYSLRHIARRYRELGFVSVAIRMPATAPCRPR